MTVCDEEFALPALPPTICFKHISLHHLLFESLRSVFMFQVMHFKDDVISAYKVQKLCGTVRFSFEHVMKPIVFYMVHLFDTLCFETQT